MQVAYDSATQASKLNLPEHTPAYPTPEPSTALMFATGVIGLIGGMWINRHRS